MANKYPKLKFRRINEDLEIVLKRQLFPLLHLLPILLLFPVISTKEKSPLGSSRRLVCVAHTLEGVQGFAGADGGQGLLVVELIVELRRARGGVDGGFDLNLRVLLLRVAAIRAAQGSTHTRAHTHTRGML